MGQFIFPTSLTSLHKRQLLFKISLFFRLFFVHQHFSPSYIEIFNNSMILDRYCIQMYSYQCVNSLIQECIPVGCVPPAAVGELVLIPLNFPLDVGLDLTPSISPLGVGLDLIPLNFPLGCGPGSDPPQFPPWVWAWI